MSRTSVPTADPGAAALTGVSRALLVPSRARRRPPTVTPSRRREPTRPLTPDRPRRTTIVPARPRGMSGRRSIGPRLTRRGRLLIVLVMAGVLFAAFSIGRASTDAAVTPRPAAAVPTVVVHPGDTLWSLARRIDRGADPRVTVDQLQRLNRLRPGPLIPGRRLTVPTR